MKMKYNHIFGSILLLIPCFLFAQAPTTTAPKLFEESTLFQLSLNGNTKKLIKDRRGKATKFPMNLSYTLGQNESVNIPVLVKTRGNFRRTLGGCKYPPLRIEFEEGHESTVFKDQKKLKLVVPCQGEKYVIKEWLAYRIYELLTPFSFRTRLVKVQLEDSKSNKSRPPFLAFLLEEEKQMAKRNEKIVIEKNLKPRSINKPHFIRMAIFQYLIGNTDWSVEYQQNIKVLANSSKDKLYSVPYDFDHAGLVGAPYAQPSEALKMESVLERRYRGYCTEDWETIQAVLKEFIEIKPELYQLIQDCEYLDDRERKRTILFLDDFYKTLNNPNRLKQEISYPCDPNGTGGVVIKGLKG